MKYKVEVCRTEVKVYTYEVESDDGYDAREKAMQEAYDMDWNRISGNDVEYTAECIDDIGGDE